MGIPTCAACKTPWGHQFDCSFLNDIMTTRDRYKAALEEIAAFSSSLVATRVANDALGYQVPRVLTDAEFTSDATATNAGSKAK